MHKELEN